MIRRMTGVVCVLSIVLLGVFANLVADPSSLIVDADRPSIDHARPRDDPSVGNDLTRLFLPHHLAIARSFARLGRIPGWDDRGFGGRPLVGNPQAGLFYPPTWLAWWTGTPAALGWITVGHLLGMGLGTYGLSRTLGLGVCGALVAGGCVQVSPYVLAQTFEGHYPHVWAASWYPWAFLAALKLRRGDLAGGFWLVPILAATLLAGHPQEGYYLLLALGSWAAYDGLVALRSAKPSKALTIWGLWAALVFLAIGLTGVELIPDALAQEWALRGTRLSMRLAGRYHVYPINLIQLLGPQALGGPHAYFGHENYWETVVSIGLIPLFLAGIGVAWSNDRQNVRGWLLLVMVSLLFASGRNFGVFPLLFEVMPGMDRFRVPARALFLTSLGGAILAGMGVEALRAKAGMSGGWGKLAGWAFLFAGVVATLVIAGPRPWSPLTNKPGELDRLANGLGRLASDPAFWLPLTALPVGLTLASKVKGARRAIGLVLGLLSLVELGVQGQRLITTTPASRWLDAGPIGKILDEARSPGPTPTRIRVVDTLFDDLRAGELGFEKTNVNDSFQIQHAAELYESLYRLFDAHKFVSDSAMDQEVARYRREVRQSVLDRMGVSLLVDDRDDPGATWPRIGSGVWSGSSFVVYRNPSCLPPAYVVPRSEPAPESRELLDRFRRVDPRQTVLMDRDPIGGDPAIRQAFTQADWLSDDPDRVNLRVETEAPGLLVIGSTWMPGWTAQVDGRAAPVLRGNHAQRVVPLHEPGRHEVILSYRPPGFAAGLALTTGSATAWLGLLVWLRPEESVDAERKSSVVHAFSLSGFAPSVLIPSS